MNMPIESSGRPWSKTKESPRSRAEDFLTQIDQYIVECYLCTPEHVSDDTGYYGIFYPLKEFLSIIETREFDFPDRATPVHFL